MPLRWRCTQPVLHFNRSFLRSLDIGRVARYLEHICKFSTSINYNTEEELDLQNRNHQQPKLPFPHDPKIDPNSLSKTLEAHREANRALLISKIDQDLRRRPLVLEKSNTDLHVPVSGHKEPQFHGTVRLDLQREADFGSPDVLRYASKGRDLTREWLPGQRTSRQKHWPWIYNRNASIQSPEHRLTEEIKHFDSWLSPTAKEQEASDSAINEIRERIQHAASQRKQKWRVDVIGSRASGFATPLSDIDLNIRVISSDVGQQVDTPTQRRRLLRKLSWDLRKDANPNDSGARGLSIEAFIPKAKVPVISGTHVPSGLQFQIQTSTSCYGSLEYAKRYMKEYPGLRPIFKVMRQALKMRGLTDGVHGGITSYPLLIMIVAALKLSQEKIAPHDYGAQLRHFLDMYAAMDFQNTGMSMSPLKFVPKTVTEQRTRHLLNEETIFVSITNTQTPTAASLQEQQVPEGLSEKDRANQKYFDIFTVNPSTAFLPVLQDPADPENNLGRSLYLIGDLQATFIQLKEALETRLTQNGQASLQYGTIDNQPWSIPILDPLLGADYGLLMGARLELRNFVSTSIVTSTRRDSETVTGNPKQRNAAFDLDRFLLQKMKSR